MTVTPQTNATLEEIAEAVMKHESFCVCGHINPDGDCIGSTLAISRALEAVGKAAQPLVADDAPIDQSFQFMPGADRLLSASMCNEDIDVFIAVDTPSDNRLGEAACIVRDRAKLTITLDHHAAPERMSDLSYTDPDSTSASLIIWKLVRLLGIDQQSSAMREIAECAYAGLLTDSGRFMFQNTNAESFQLALQMVECGIDTSEISRALFQERPLEAVLIDGVAIDHMELLCNGRVALSWLSLNDMESIGADSSDTDNAINVIRQISGVEVACVLKEREDSVRGSLRAKNSIDVSSLARQLGGGGHRAAAGFTLNCSLDEARESMRAHLSDLLD